MKNISAIATSQAAGNPWVNINSQDAKNACMSIGMNYDLISNVEWMVIAHEIEKTASNWSTGTVGSGHLNRGWSANESDDGFGNTAIAPSTDSSCLYNTNENTCASTGDHKFKRTHRLSNNEEIWDFSGNVWEWVDWSLGGGLSTGPTDCPANWIELPDVAAASPCSLSAAEYLPENPIGVTASEYNADYGLGRIYGGSGGGYARRGGAWLYGTRTGIFMMNLNSNASALNTNIGFRCVYRP